MSLNDKKQIRNQKTLNVNEILQHSSLSGLLEQHQKRQQFYRNIEQCIPTQFRGQIRIAQYNEEKILFHVANGSVRQALLLQQAQLLRNINTICPTINQLEFKVIPTMPLSSAV
ncbi:hypothetical protein P375_02635 [Gallibacterium genomosp. 2]|uniref:DUF721 domain-containing protein n=1 Tax=Gallibacterium genomosp. 2 TaxID=155517 RepID=A0A0A2XS20_9PAST|nr:MULTISPECIES: DciA family protein [Gallibacterium]KGQ33495.1 hypothetical protein P375_02635 [Gallibacterium genomosp. 2]OBX01968.1 hypothetical protein QV04_04420 [Gallibacterium genomosp. 1]